MVRWHISTAANTLAHALLHAGEWLNGERHGKGRMRFKGSPFQQLSCMWSDDLPCGPGTLTYRDGSSYNGNFQAGLLHGVGTLERTQPDGTRWFVYEGAFIKGMTAGRGKLTYMVSAGAPGMASEVIVAEGDFSAGNFAHGRILFPAADRAPHHVYRGEHRPHSPCTARKWGAQVSGS